MLANHWKRSLEKDEEVYKLASDRHWILSWAFSTIESGFRKRV